MTLPQRHPLFLSLLFLFFLPSIANASDYWQQEVNYRIDVTLASDLRTITGTIDIQYINNSPDTLRVLYLKAFPNAVQRGSYADLAARQRNEWALAGIKPENEASLTLVPIPERTRDGSVRSEQSPPFTVDNSIITVTLNHPIAQGDTAKLKYGLKTVLPNGNEMRMGKFQRVSKAAYWYPQVCVYDRKLGWVNAQYIGWGECYGDFGTFDVTITAPEDQIVASTGVLVNESEAIPDSLRQQYDLSNFLKPKSDWPNFQFDSSKTKTWHFVAEKTNDFAFSCSNNWCLDTTSYKGVQIVAYALREKANGWKDAARIGREAIETYSDKFLPYQWPVIRICDAYSGMEFPMLANCGGSAPSPGYYVVIYHEVGHQWFMGMIGSNQIDRPFIDEGFNVLGEHVTMEKYLGRNGNMDNFQTWYRRAFAPSTEDRDDRGFRPLMLLQQQGMDKPMVFNYDQGEEYFPWRVSAYYKSAAMHYSLRSLLGDSAYFAAMQHYCKEWVFKHPYEDDFTQAMEDATGLELDPFLDQWYYTRDRLDYALDDVSSSLSANEKEFTHSIKLKRPGKFVAPVEIAVIWDQGDTSMYLVTPEGMEFARPEYRLLPTWNQFRRYSDKYEFTIRSERQIKKVVLDPENISMDIDRLNNASGLFPPTEFRFDNMKFDRTPVNTYALRVRPDFWYDTPNGFQIGAHSHGSYLEEVQKFSLDARIGTKSGRPTVDYRWSNPFKPFGNMSSLETRILLSDYRQMYQVSLDKTYKRWYSRPDRVFVHFDHSLIVSRPENSNRFVAPPDNFTQYLADPNWEMSRIWTSSAQVGWLTTFRNGELRVAGNSQAVVYGEFDENRSAIEDRIDAHLRLSNAKRTWMDLSGGFNFTFGRPPAQFVRQLSRARAIDAFSDSKLFRSPGTFPTKWQSDFYLSGGPVRGYQDRPIWFYDSWNGSLEITPPDILPFRWFKKLPLVGGFLSRTDHSVWVDAAWITMQGSEYDYRAPIRTSETALDGKQLRSYTSAGFSLNFPPVWSQHHVRLDFPLYINRPAPGEREFAFRFSAAWILPLKW